MITRRQPERDLQQAFMAWTLEARQQHPELNLFIHIRNEGMDHVAARRAFKRLGVKRGVPDLFLPVPRGGRHGLWLELKSPTGRLSPEQKMWRDALIAQGYAWEVAWTFDAAVTITLGYIMSPGERVARAYTSQARRV